MIEPLFSRDPEVIRYPDCEGPPLTDDMVAAAERELGVTLPRAYVDLMRTCNGGYTRDAAFGTSRPTSWSEDHVPVDVIFGIPATDDRGRGGRGALGRARGRILGRRWRGEPGLGILQTTYMTAEWDLPRRLVLLNGDGHWWIALDYRGSGRSGPPSVVWIDVEVGDELPLADSFEAFLAGLEPTSSFIDPLAPEATPPEAEPPA